MIGDIYELIDPKKQFLLMYVEVVAIIDLDTVEAISYYRDFSIVKAIWEKQFLLKTTDFKLLTKSEAELVKALYL